MQSSEAITGPKVDRWLVKMVGLLAAGIGGSIAAGLCSDGLLELALIGCLLTGSKR